MGQFWALYCLFCIYADDITSVVTFSSLNIFADDISVYAKVSSFDDCLQIQEDTSHIYKWAVKWQLTLSIG